MKKVFCFNMNFLSTNVNIIKVHVILVKSGIIMNVVVSVKNQMVGVLLKTVMYGILARGIVNVIKHVKLMNV